MKNLAIVFLLLGVGGLFRYRPADDLVDFRCRDGLVYAAVATQVAEKSDFAVSVGGERYPPRYPLTFPLWLAAAAKISGRGLAAMNAAVWIPASAGAVFLWLWGRRCGAPWTGVVAGMVLTISPAHILWSRRLVPHALMAAAIPLLFYLIARLRCQRLGLAFAWGLAVGVAATCHYALSLLVIPILAFAWFDAPTPRSFNKTFVAIAVGMFIALSPQGYFNARVFGSPFRTGYQYWVPDSHDWSSIGVSYLLANPDVGEGNVVFYAKRLIGGSGGFFSPFLWPFVLFGAFLVLRQARRDPKRRPFAALLLLTPAVFLAFHGVTRFVSISYLLPALPCFCLLGAVGWVHTAGWIASNLSPSAIALVALPCLIPVWALPGKSAAHVAKAVIAASRPPRPAMTDARTLLLKRTPPRCLILSDESDLAIRMLIGGKGQRRHFPLAGTEQLDRVHGFRLPRLVGNRLGGYHLPRQLILAGEIQEVWRDYILAQMEKGIPVFVLTRKWRTDVLPKLGKIVSIRQVHRADGWFLGLLVKPATPRRKG